MSRMLHVTHHRRESHKTGGKSGSAEVKYSRDRSWKDDGLVD